MKTKPSAGLVRTALGLKFVRIVGARIFPIYRTELPDGQAILLRTGRLTFPDDGAITEVYELGIYEKFFRIEPEDNVLDLGAHIGSFTLRAAKEVGLKGMVVAVEPSSENFELLEKNIALNGCSNVKLLQTAAGKDFEVAEFFIHENPSSNSFYNSRTKTIRSEKVTIRTLDSIIDELQFKKVDFVKIDVEGAELDVLKGATSTISKYHPKVVLELHSFGPSADDVAHFLEQFGYATKRVPYREGNEILYCLASKTGEQM